MPLHTAVATISTSLGDIRVNLLGNHAPKTVRNFTGLATGEIEWTHPATGVKSNTPLYDGVIFHRIIKQFMLQGGDPLGQGVGGPGYEFDDEINSELNFNEPYVLAMVTLDEGVNVMANLIRCTEEDLKAGLRVKPYWHPLSDGRHLLLFEPDR